MTGRKRLLCVFALHGCGPSAVRLYNVFFFINGVNLPFTISSLASGRTSFFLGLRGCDLGLICFDSLFEDSVYIFYTFAIVANKILRFF